MLPELKRYDDNRRKEEPVKCLHGIVVMVEERKKEEKRQSYFENEALLLQANSKPGLIGHPTRRHLPKPFDL